MKTFSFTVVLALAAISLAACSSMGDLTKEKWTITVSKGNQQTGLSNGFTMIETGEVFAWGGKEGDHERTNKVGSVSVERAHEFKEVLAANLDTIQLNAPGSMSTSIKLEEDDRVQSITWGSTDHPNVPDALKEWYDDFMNACGAMQTQ